MADLISMLAAVAGSGGGADPNFNQTVLLLHGDGTNGAQNNTFLDGSTNNFTITRNGNTTQGTFSPFSLAAGEWSNYFDGTGDTLTAADNAAFDLGSGDWTIELWANFGSVSGEKGLVSHFATPALSTGYTLRLSTGNSPSGLRLVCSSGGGTDVILQAAWSPVVSVWYHIAAVRDGGTLRLYVDGVQIGSTSIAITIGNPSTTFAVGTAQTVASSDMNGYISNVRLVKGTCLYTGGTTFTPPTAPLTAISGTSLLTCQSNRFVDNSTNAFAITRNGDVRVTPFSPFAPTAAYSAGTNGGSGYFGGDGNYISAPYNAAFDFSTGDFTVECFAWVIDAGRGNDSNKYGTFLGGGANLSTTNLWSTTLLITSGVVSSLLFEVNGSSVLTASGQSIPLNAWHHFVFCRTGTTLSIFVNGSRVGTTTYSSAINTNSGGTVQIARSPYGGTFQNWFSGYIANARIIKGSGPYDATQTTLTVPTAPLTAITNTSLLCNFTNAGIFDNTGKNNLETVGNAQIDTAVKKFGTGSLEFDGTGDYLDSPSIENVQFGTGDFTIEGWLYINSLAAAQVLFEFRAVNGASYGQVYITTGGVLRFYLPTDYGTSNTFTTSTWTHFAIARSAGTLKMFIGGAEGFSGSYTSAMDATRFRIGADTAGGSGFNGYIDDLRITKGVARYTAAFTPPTAAFPNE